MQVDDFIAVDEERRSAKRCARCKSPHHNEGWYCDVCLGKAPEPEKERIEMPTNFNGVSSDPLACPVCGKVCGSAAGLGGHKSKVHGIKGKTAQPEPKRKGEVAAPSTSTGMAGTQTVARAVVTFPRLRFAHGTDRDARCPGDRTAAWRRSV